jgi:hypothetical protein
VLERGAHRSPALVADKSPAEASPAGLSFVDPARAGAERYFSELLMAVYCVFRFVPSPLTTAIMASAIPAAIRPYSIAVAPDSSDKKFSNSRFNSASFGLPVTIGRRIKNAMQVLKSH